MIPDSDSVLSISSVTKNYGALRPLRIERFELRHGQQVALVGLDQPAAEVFINLVTGAGLPEAGTVSVCGRQTASITDSDEWLSTLDRFGIVSQRAPLLGALTVAQNLTLSFTLDIDSPSDEVLQRATALATAVGLPQTTWDRPAQALEPAGRLRLRLARALALDPVLLIIEHPSAELERQDVVPLARDIRALVAGRGTATITITMDRELADAVAPRTLTLDPASGRLKEGWLARMGFRS